MDGDWTIVGFPFLPRCGLNRKNLDGTGRAERHAIDICMLLFFAM